MWRQHSIMDTYDNANLADQAPPGKIHPETDPVSSNNDVAHAQMSVPVPAPTSIPPPTTRARLHHRP